MLTILALYVAALARVVHSASRPLPGSQGMALRGPVDQVNVRTGDDLSLTERYAGPHVGMLAYFAGGEAPKLNEHGVVLLDFGGNAHADLQFAAQAPVPARSLGAVVGATKETSTTITTIAAGGVEAQTSDEPGVILPYVDGHSRAYIQIASEVQAAARSLSEATGSKLSLGASVAVLSIFLITILVCSKLCGVCAEAKFGRVGDQPEEGPMAKETTEAPATCAVAGSVLTKSFSEDVDDDGQMPRDTLEAECHEAVATQGAEPPFTSAHFIEDEKAKSGNTLGDPDFVVEKDLEEEWC